MSFKTRIFKSKNIKKCIEARNLANLLLSKSADAVVERGDIKTTFTNHSRRMWSEEECRVMVNAEIPMRAWKTRREKYGERGHGGAYCHPKPIYTARWNERLNSMQDMLIRLYRQGVLSEGQVSKACGLDRVTCRDLAIQQEQMDKFREKHL